MNVRERLYKVFARELDCEVRYLSEEAHLFRDLGIDSLGTVCLIMSLEEELKIEILDEQADRLRTFGDVMNLPQIKALE